MFHIQGEIAGKEVNLKVSMSPVEALKLYIAVLHEAGNRKQEIELAMQKVTQSQ